MTDAPQTTADPYAETLTHDPVCACGSCRQLLDETLAEFQAMIAKDEKCLHWIAGKAAAWSAIAYILLLGDQEQNPKDQIVHRLDRLALLYGDDSAVMYTAEQVAAIFDSATTRPN